MAKKTASKPASAEAQPQYKVEYREIQPYGTLKSLPLALEGNARKQSVETLNQVLVDTMTLRDLYKNITGKCRARPSTSCICCSISIMRSRQNLSI